MTKDIRLGDTGTLQMATSSNDKSIHLSLPPHTASTCRLHWGLSATAGGDWRRPPEAMLPPDSVRFDATAVQTPFPPGKSLELPLPEGIRDTPYLRFALYFPDEDRWENNGGGDFSLRLVAREGPAPGEALAAWDAPGDSVEEQVFSPDEGWEVAAAVRADDACLRVRLLTDLPGEVVLHWGVGIRSRYEWRLPPEDLLPPDTVVSDEKAVRTPFAEDSAGETGLRRLDLEFPRDKAPLSLTFVLHAVSAGRWIKNGSRDFRLVLQHREESETGLPAFAERIIEAETGKNSWTLMHRYNLCHDLLDEARESGSGMALLFVWLRFSTLRQLDWQRNYNTKPRELAHAQDRLTARMTELFQQEPEHRETLRLMLGSIGRGGDGQRIRDEILHIMHRHHIKEVSGHFMEEWHQKLHNNTTPDDVAICRAYVEFLRSDGNLDRFHGVLEEEGVTRERLASFERPITTPPDFVPHLKDALIHDFEHFLGLLRAIHCGADLHSAAGRARGLLDDELAGHLGAVTHPDHLDLRTLPEFLNRIRALRRRLHEVIVGESDTGRARDALDLDLALEETLRVAVESRIHEECDDDLLVRLTGRVLDEAAFGSDDPELEILSRAWNEQPALSDGSDADTLRLMALLDRLHRALSAATDSWYRRLQPLAEALGHAFGAEDWTIDLFAEAVVRGRPAFALSSLLNRLEPRLRLLAGAGPWRVISPGEATGRVVRTAALGDLQGKSFSEATVVVADNVRGDEEPPAGINGLVTGGAVDLVSHLAVRARNMPVFFATCHDSNILEELKGYDGRWLRLESRPSGEVAFEEAEEQTASRSWKSGKKQERTQVKRPDLSHEPLARGEFTSGRVGGKSLNLARLDGKLPAWIHLPPSVALPFGTCEHVFEAPENSDRAREMTSLLERLEKDPAETLKKLRETARALEAPAGFLDRLRKVMDRNKIPELKNSAAGWRCVKDVWASKWNDRAYYSRRARGLKEEDLYMAVLIQEIVPAEYAFVLHTVNPLNGDTGEIYGEAVPGLGETIVGNYPGGALSFTVRKDTREPSVLAYPSKSVGLFGSGHMFRSDSNAEDLEGYAGAGLYDSVALPPAREERLEFGRDALTGDDAFLQEFLRNLAEIGLAVEKTFDSPQDIEGAFAGGHYHVLQSRPQV